MPLYFPRLILIWLFEVITAKEWIREVNWDPVERSVSLKLE
jgi:hypothetical protein